MRVEVYSQSAIVFKEIALNRSIYTEKLRQYAVSRTVEGRRNWNRSAIKSRSHAAFSLGNRDPEVGRRTSCALRRVASRSI